MSTPTAFSVTSRLRAFYAFAMLLAQLRHLFDMRLHLVAEFPDRCLDPFAFFLRELLEFFIVEDLAVVDRRQDETGGRLQQANPFPAGPFLEFAPLALKLLLRRRLDRLELRPVIVALECRRDGETQLFDQLMHVLAKRLAHARREPGAPPAARDPRSC